MRAVLDPNVLVSAVISPAGPPGSILLAWSLRQFQLVISARLLDELAEVLARPKLQRWVSQATAHEYVDALAESANMIEDPPDPPKRSADPDDDYLPALLDAADAKYLVSGDPPPHRPRRPRLSRRNTERLPRTAARRRPAK